MRFAPRLVIVICDTMFEVIIQLSIRRDSVADYNLSGLTTRQFPRTSFSGAPDELADLNDPPVNPN